MANFAKIPRSSCQVMLAKVFGTTTGLIGYNNTTVPSTLRVYKGVPPTDINTINDAYLTSRASDLLITFDYNSTYNVVTYNKAVLDNPAYTAASASGEATWFILMAQNATSKAIVQLITGTVTNASGSGDLRLNDTNLVQGTSYRVQALNFMLPYEYTF